MKRYSVVLAGERAAVVAVPDDVTAQELHDLGAFVHGLAEELEERHPLADQMDEAEQASAPPDGSSEDTNSPEQEP